MKGRLRKGCMSDGYYQHHHHHYRAVARDRTLEASTAWNGTETHTEARMDAVRDHRGRRPTGPVPWGLWGA